MECVVQQGFDCSDGNPCTEDFCNPEAGDGEQKCTHTYVGDDITCVEDGVTGVCKDGVCDADAPPSEPVISLTPEGASPGAHLFCQVTQASVDPDGDAVEYHFEWHKEGVHVPQYDEILTGALPQVTLPFTVTQSCELWSCFVTPVANGLQGPTATASVTTGPDGSVGNGADKVAHNWPPSGGQFPATVGPLQGWGAGEGFAVRIEFDESELPFTIGVIRGVIPNGQAWMAKIWEDQFGQPGFEVASQPGQGTSSTELTDYALSQPYTVASGTSAVWVGFINQNGNGPIPYDEGGATPNSSNPQNYLYGSYIDLLGGGGCPTFFAPCWLPATLHEPNIKNWVVEVGPGTPACP